MTSRSQPSSVGLHLTAHAPVVEVLDDIAAGRRVTAHEAHLRESLSGFQTMFERSALGQVIVDLPSFRIGVVTMPSAR